MYQIYEKGEESKEEQEHLNMSIREYQNKFDVIVPNIAIKRFSAIVDVDSAIRALAKFDLSKKNQKNFVVLFLDINNNVIESAIISTGGKTLTHVDIPLIMKMAFLNDSSSLLVAHNNSSGGSKFSPEDLKTTKALIEVGTFTGIILLDHLLYAQGAVISLKSIRPELGWYEGK